jgi:P4 family phage/plasmid primase-like protien
LARPKEFKDDSTLNKTDSDFEEEYAEFKRWRDIQEINRRWNYSSGGNYNDNDKSDGAAAEKVKRKPTQEILDDFYKKLMNRFTFKTIADSQEILWYDPRQGVYCFNGEVKIKRELEKIFDEELQNGNISIANLLLEQHRNEIVKRIQWNTTIEREKFEDHNTTIINVQNGLLDTKTKKLKLHSPDFLTTKQFPIRYDPNARWTEMLKFLKQVQNREGVTTLLKMFGYILMTNTVKYQKAFFFVGRGDNGKSVLIDLIEAFVGADNCSSVKLHDLRNDKFMAAQMYGKIVNTYADIPGTGLQDVGLFKALVSGDRITGQHKYGKLFRFRNRAKLIFSGNTIPLSEGEDDLAYFKRWVILKFDSLFKDEKQDRDLIKKLTTEENLSALLNLALVGITLLEREGFEKVPIEVIREEYDRESQSFRSFIGNECTIDLAKSEYYTPVSDFNDSYLRSCNEQKELGGDFAEPLTPEKLELELAKYKIFEKRMQVNGVKKSCYKGIITREEANRRNQVILELQKQKTLTEESTN